MNIVITGGVTGVGGSIASHFRQAGHQVFTIGKSADNDYRMDFTAPWLPPTLGAIVDEAMEGATEYFKEYDDVGTVDVLINNAGITHHDWMEDFPLQKMMDVLQCDLIYPWLFMQWMARRSGMHKVMSTKGMEDRESRIINVISMACKRGMRGSTAYMAAKCGLEGLTRAAAKEFAGRNKVLVFGISPATIEGTSIKDQMVTDLIRMRGMDKETAETYATETPLGSLVTHADFNTILDFLVKDAPSAMNGSVLWCTGGTGL